MLLAGAALQLLFVVFLSKVVAIFVQVINYVAQWIPTYWNIWIEPFQHFRSQAVHRYALVHYTGIAFLSRLGALLSVLGTALYYLCCPCLWPSNFFEGDEPDQGEGW